MALPRNDRITNLHLYCSHDVTRRPEQDGDPPEVNFSDPDVNINSLHNTMDGSQC